MSIRMGVLGKEMPELQVKRMDHIAMDKLRGLRARFSGCTQTHCTQHIHQYDCEGHRSASQAKIETETVTSGSIFPKTAD